MKYREYSCIVIGAAAGACAGIWGLCAGIAAGTFAALVLHRLEDERMWRKAAEKGSTAGVSGEPFPGALFVCALAVSCTGDSTGACQIVKGVFGKKYHADWNSFCRAAASVKSLNSDLLVECLAHIIRKNSEVYTPDMVRAVFTLLSAAEFSRDRRQTGDRPSHYLAELLDYTYVSDELSLAYRVLGLEPGAEIERVKSAHRRLAAKYHPDRGTENNGGTDTFMRVQAAYELILHQQS